MHGAQRLTKLQSQDAPLRRQRGPVHRHRLSMLALVLERVLGHLNGLERLRVVRPVQALLRGQDAAQQRLGLGVLAHVWQRGRQVGLRR